MFSLVGFVSSKRRLHSPPNSWPMPKFKQMDFAWPICKCPLGSGGKRVCTCLPLVWLFRSAVTLALIKSMEECWSGDDIVNKLSENYMQKFPATSIFQEQDSVTLIPVPGQRVCPKMAEDGPSKQLFQTTCRLFARRGEDSCPHATMSRANSQHKQDNIRSLMVTKTRQTGSRQRRHESRNSRGK